MNVDASKYQILPFYALSLFFGNGHSAEYIYMLTHHAFTESLNILLLSRDVKYPRWYNAKLSLLHLSDEVNIYFQ